VAAGVFTINGLVPVVEKQGIRLISCSGHHGMIMVRSSLEFYVGIDRLEHGWLESLILVRASAFQIFKLCPMNI